MPSRRDWQPSEPRQNAHKPNKPIYYLRPEKQLHLRLSRGLRGGVGGRLCQSSTNMTAISTARQNTLNSTVPSTSRTNVPTAKRKSVIPAKLCENGCRWNGQPTAQKDAVHRIAAQGSLPTPLPAKSRAAIARTPSVGPCVREERSTDIRRCKSPIRNWVRAEAEVLRGRRPLEA